LRNVVGDRLSFINSVLRRVAGEYVKAFSKRFLSMIFHGYLMDKVEDWLCLFESVFEAYNWEIRKSI
jgi:hypothetical protein